MSSDPRPPGRGDAEAAAKALASSPAAYRSLLEAATDAVTISDFDSALFIDSNREASELFGYTAEEFLDLTGRKLASPSASHDVDAISAELVSRGHARHPNLRFRRKDGSEFWGELRVSMFVLEGRRFYFATMRDVTERVERQAELARAYENLRAAQAQLVHSSKLAVIGEMAAGIAHEINNPASWVSTNLRELRHWVADLQKHDPEVALSTERIAEAEEMIVDSIEGIDRIVSIVHDMRPFARAEPDAIEGVQLDEVVRGACKIVRNQISHRARLVTRLGDPAPLNGDRSKLGQVVANLLLNAAQAIEEGAANDNEVVVETSEQDGIVRLAVSDTGSGIPDAVRDRIFDPFFTTKPGETGTGLGLALCAEIVRRHRGEIRVASQPVKGTVFEVLLPRDNGLVPVERSAPSPVGLPTTRRLRVLLIDDELALLHAYRRSLAGYDVTIACGGAEGLLRIEQDPPFDAIVCDLMMPDIDGFKVFDALRARAPELVDRLVFVTGGAFTDRARGLIDSLSRPVLHKPVKRAALAEAILAVSKR